MHSHFFSVDTLDCLCETWDYMSQPANFEDEIDFERALTA